MLTVRRLSTYMKGPRRQNAYAKKKKKLCDQVCFFEFFLSFFFFKSVYFKAT